MKSLKSFYAQPVSTVLCRHQHLRGSVVLSHEVRSFDFSERVSCGPTGQIAPPLGYNKYHFVYIK